MAVAAAGPLARAFAGEQQRARCLPFYPPQEHEMKIKTKLRGGPSACR